MNILLSAEGVLITTFQGSYSQVNIIDGKIVSCLPTENVTGIYIQEKDTIYPLDVRIIENIDIPLGVEPGKYCYNAANGFYLNPNWKEPPKTQEQLTEDINFISLHQFDVELDIDYRLSMIELGLV